MNVFLMSAQTTPGLEVFAAESALVNEAMEVGLDVEAQLIFPLGNLPTHLALPQHVV